MTGQLKTDLCRYQYDPLDQIASCAPLNQQSIQRFYRNHRLATEIQGQKQYSFFEHETQLLAQQQREAGKVDCALQATDLQGSVLHAVAVGQHQRMVYSPYGHRFPVSGEISLLGFNGERRDSVTGYYLLGKGYRAFNPVLKRFNSPDDMSPFGKGGLNGYNYCEGDPVNCLDPSGHSLILASYFKFLERTRGTALSGVGSQTLNKIPSPAKTLGSPVVRETAVPISSVGRQSTSQIEALDLALPKARDRGRLLDTLEGYVKAQEKLNSAKEQYSVLERFAAFPPRRKDGTIEIENFNSADIVNQRDYKQLEKAQSDFASARANLVSIKKEYFDRYPRDYNELMSTIRSGRRKSF
ncbi:RHS repeat-associated core domain-containing protein [Pseudomonas sp. C1C7]|uniref:RHS repeat-associated core domain-containing protein n=1 Tax=Pseudomonas sp. C1C7 TaxID=2735272 RepID=UPI0015868723|nr:RHS repeat-associated core domain-containing protein [Pseudomonas sp. C1C7]NUT75464.1 RHS repeat-associated core domain-containing protein [Pseudomonas sp. C1C7]